MSGLSARRAPRRTMHGAPLWARAATVAAGPVFNFIFAFVVFRRIALFTKASRWIEPVVGEIAELPRRAFRPATGRPRSVRRRDRNRKPCPIF